MNWPSRDPAQQYEGQYFHFLVFHTFSTVVEIFLRLLYYILYYRKM